MNREALLAPDAGALLGESRGRVLDLLRSAPGALDVREVAERAGLHPNTARFHLDALVRAGLAARQPRARATPGRPSMAYSSTGGGDAGRRHYRLLAEMLASMISGTTPRAAGAATEAGREWGRYLAGQMPPYESLDAGQAVVRLTVMLAEIGFDPEAVASATGYQLRLRQCPFREVADRHQDVVCPLHLGLMRGVLEQLRAPVTADHLQPFAEPGICTAELSVRERGHGRERPAGSSDGARRAR